MQSRLNRSFGLLFFAAMALMAQSDLGRASELSELQLISSVPPQANYEIYFRATKESLQFNRPGYQRSWSQLVYKIAPSSHLAADPFSGSGWVKVRFQDKEGFDLVTDLIHRSELNAAHEYYAYLWAETARVGRIVQAALSPLTSEELDFAEKERTRSMTEIAQLIDNSGRDLKLVYRLQHESLFEKNAPPMEEGASEVPATTASVGSHDSSSNSQQPVTAEQTSKPMGNGGEAQTANPLFGSEVITNETIQNALQEYDKMAPTNLEASDNKENQPESDELPVG